MNENELAAEVFDAGLKVHRALGPGLLESAYEECLHFELCKRGLSVQRQKGLPLVYESVKMEIGYRVDLLIENKLIVEIKAVEAINEIHIAQVLTYLKLSNCKLGLLINFHSSLFKNGVKRLINGQLEV